jgi:hypothetical protein
MDPFEFHRMVDAENAAREQGQVAMQDRLDGTGTEWADAPPTPFPPRRSVREKNRARRRFRGLRHKKGR